MRSNPFVRVLFFVSLLYLPFGKSVFAQHVDRVMVRDIYETALDSSKAYDFLRELCYDIGPRLSGSPEAERAVRWAKHKLKSFDLDSVWLQEVYVPQWRRGKYEEAWFKEEKCNHVNLSVIALGGTVATKEGGIKAPVIEVKSLEEVDKLGRQAIEGKIVFYNRAFSQSDIHTFKGYRKTVDQRVVGPSKAAEYGAVAVVIRSVTTAEDDTPHTGMLIYDGIHKKIPAAALGVQSAIKLSEALKANPNLKLHLNIEAEQREDALSYNVIGEIKGNVKPDSIILLGAHLDSWDVGHGAHDDGAGTVHVMEVLRLLKQIGYKPKYTIRTVLFMNEENGLKGALKYADKAVENGENYLFAIESDAGGFAPRAFNMKVNDQQYQKMIQWLDYFHPSTISYIRRGGGGIDIDPLHKKLNVPVGSLNVESQRMFDLHHSALDVFESVNKRELHLGVAALTSLVYLIDQNGL